MKHHRLRALATLGQSLRLDYISRELILSGELKSLIEQDGLKGMTSNPSLFEKAIEEGEGYRSDIRAVARAKKNAPEIYEAIDKFNEPFDKLLDTLEKERAAVRTPGRITRSRKATRRGPTPRGREAPDASEDVRGEASCNWE